MEEKRLCPENRKEENYSCPCNAKIYLGKLVGKAYYLAVKLGSLSYLINREIAEASS